MTNGIFRRPNVLVAGDCLHRLEVTTSLNITAWRWVSTFPGVQPDFVVAGVQEFHQRAGHGAAGAGYGAAGVVAGLHVVAQARRAAEVQQRLVGGRRDEVGFGTFAFDARPVTLHALPIEDRLDRLNVRQVPRVAATFFRG